MNSSSNKPLLELPEVQTWDLGGKVVLITGGASGIGAATARLAASDGATVVLCDVDENNGREIADEISGRFVPLDVTSPLSWAQATQDLEQLDIAILNAGVEFRDPADFKRTADNPAEWNLDLYEKARGVNVDGVAFGLHALVPVFERLGGGSITVTASIAGLIPWSPDPIYSMTKWAAVGLVRASATSLRRQNILINAVCPGGVATPMTRVFDGTVPPGMADPLHIATAHLGIATSGHSGRVIKAVAGFPHTAHQFAEVTDTF